MLGYFKSIYKIEGISELPHENSVLLDIGRNGPTITLTGNIDPFCQDYDISRALMMAMWSGFGRIDEAQQENLFQEHLKEATFQREKQFKNGVFLIFESKSTVDFDPKRSLGRIKDFYFCINEFEKGVFGGKFSPLVRKVLISLILSLAEGKTLSILEVGRVIHLKDQKNRIIFPFTIEAASLSLKVSGKFNRAAKKQFLELWENLRRKEKYNNIFSLFYKSITEQDNKLLSFVHGWTALEFFINTAFKEKYGKEWVSILSKGGPPTSSIFFERIQDIMKDKYRPADKFLAIATLLNPKNASDDYDKFMEIKSFRDSLFHGETFKETDYPISKTQALLKTYLKLHLKK